MFVVHLILSILMTNVSSNPVELGKVSWNRDYETALSLSKEMGKPVFILFQEVPGCSTCKNYGEEVLSHPLIVEAIEDEFVPLVIYNNKGGADKKILEQYKEPSWNNPVVRIVDASGENIVRRLYSNYSVQGIVNTMIEALLRSNKIVPDYLHLLAEAEEIKFGSLQESYVSMYCFWTGEKVIGGIKGVYDTEAGFMDGKEVVKFKYNPKLVSYKEIITTASQNNCADQVYTDDDGEKQMAKQKGKAVSTLSAYRKDKTPKYYLAMSIYQYLPMTSYQAVKINAALGQGNAVSDLLSPRQQKMIDHIEQYRSKRWVKLFDRDFAASWWKLYDEIDLRS